MNAVGALFALNLFFAFIKHSKKYIHGTEFYKSNECINLPLLHDLPVHPILHMQVISLLSGTHIVIRD